MIREKTGNNGRDDSGRFVKGNSGGPGRPRRPDLFTIAEEGAAAKGVDLREELWSVCEALLARAKEGDTQAARLLLTHLCSDGSVRGGVSLTVETGVPSGSRSA